MKNVFLTIITLCTFQAFSQNVTFTDANFKAALLNHVPKIDTSGDGEIQVEEAKAFSKYLILENKSITNLKGIEAFTNVTKIFCSGNQLTELDFSGNIELIELECSNPALISLDITKCEKLEKLVFESTKLTTLDLSKNFLLKTISLRFSPITHLDLSSNKNLKTISCTFLLLESLILPDSNNVTYLNVYDNKLTSIDLSKQTNLDQLFVFNNQLTEIDLSYNKNLTLLFIKNNKLNSLDLRGIANLGFLDCSGNQALETICLDPTQEETSSWSKDKWTEYSTTCSILTGSESFTKSESKIIKAYNLQGLEIPVDTKDEVIILQYDNGTRTKVINY